MTDRIDPRDRYTLPVDPRPKADPVRAYKDQIDALHLKVEGLQRQLEAGCPCCASTGDDWTDFQAQRGKYAPGRQT